MSGTSVDAIDAALVDFNETETGKPNLIGHYSQPFTPSMQDRIAGLFLPGDNEIDRMGALSQELGSLYADCVASLLSQADIIPNDIAAIGCHGQTVRHRPNKQYPFTCQIGDASTLAIRTGIPVIHQFRQADIALGGQGAPLVPPFHQYWFQSATQNTCIVNIGGISNITHLPASNAINSNNTSGNNIISNSINNTAVSSTAVNSTEVKGWDTGPGNGLMDAWCLKHTGKPYDNGGDWARTGSIIEPLLNQLLEHPYFSKLPPKSTGKEEFSLSWLEVLLNNTQHQNQDVQRTLLELTAQSLCHDILMLTPRVGAIYVCGGGSLNLYLMERLNQLLHPITVSSTQALGLAPCAVEASAFAWLAHQFWHRRPGNLPAVTGASREAILGQLVLP